MTTPLPRALVVDDDEAIRHMLSAVLGKEGLQVVTATDGLQALDCFRRQPAEVVLMDIRMPRLGGLEALKSILEINRDTAVILMTAFAEVGTAVRAMKDGAFDYVMKPFDIDEIRLLVQRALEIRSMRADILNLRRELSERYGAEAILTENPQMIELRRDIAKVARSNATVLIEGESGTGKELVASAIHYGSARSGGPFVRVNCAAISEALLESEFFGHEKGAFTGAVVKRIGRFEQAEHGTLFLDEIGEISPGLQVKLLRVLQEHEFERVGGSHPIRTDARIVAATNRSLSDMVEKQLFRQDLYFRLNVVRLQTIPLRQRPEDIPVLAAHFLEQFAANNGSAIPKLDPATLERLFAYPWPGNVRELANAMERAVVMGTGGTVMPDDLPKAIFDTSAAPEGMHGDCSGENPRPLRDRVRDFEAEIIRNTLARNAGDRARTAIQLGISRRALLYKLQEYGCE